MLKCKDISALSSDHIDGELPWTKRLAVYWHLFICVHCRRYLRYFRLSVFITEKPASNTPDEKAIDSIMKKVKAADANNSSPKR